MLKQILRVAAMFKKISKMKATWHKSILIIFILSRYSIGWAQERYDVTYHNDTVFNNNIPQFICQHQAKQNLEGYSLRSLDNKLQALLVVRNDSNKIKFSGSFPRLGFRYVCLYPKIEIITLLDSYIRNKVIVNGMPNLEGLKAYCKERSIPLDSIIARKKMDPAVRDSILIATAKEDAKNQVKFTFHNNAAKPVRIFIGDKPKGGSGRIQVIPPHGDFAEHARKTEKIFLLDDTGNGIKSIAVTDKLERVVIKASADDFE